MKLIFISYVIFVLSLPAHTAVIADDSEACDCTPPYASAMGESFTQINGLIGMVAATLPPGQSDQAFQRRPIPNLRKLMSIESDFRVPPMIANDTYFGHLYMADSTIRYRDQITSQRKLREERRTGAIYSSPYPVSDINGPNGMVLIKEHGAFVGVKNVGPRQFNLRSGGKVNFSFKSPGSKHTTNAQINIAINRGVPTCSLLSPQGSIVFDTLKLRSGVLGIAGGVKRIEFMKDGRIVHTIHVQ